MVFADGRGAGRHASATSLEQALLGRKAPKLVAIEAGAASQNLALEAVALGLDCGMMVEFETPKLEQAIATEPGETPYTVFVVTRPGPQAGH